MQYETHPTILAATRRAHELVKLGFRAYALNCQVRFWC